MALLLKTVVNGYVYLMQDAQSPASKDYVLSGSLVQPIFIISAYLLFVKVIGPKHMEEKKPFNLDKLMIGYNISQIILNGFIFILTGYFVLRSTPSCYLEQHNLIAISTLLYYISKILDLIDTVIFVLRKKQNQITFLHVFHHALMVFGTWVGLKYVPYGHTIYLACFNTFIHVVMYSYYLLTVWRIDLKQSLWWKKHLTQLQFIQFTLIFIIYGVALFNPDCTYPKLISLFVFVENLGMVMLFGDFYYKAYIKKKSN